MAPPGLRLVALALGLMGPPAPSLPPPGGPLVAEAETPAANEIRTSLTPANDEIAGIEADHARMLAGPMETWDLVRVRTRYEALLKADPSAESMIRDRLALVAEHETLARSAKTFRTILERSRRRDRTVAMTVRRLAALDAPRRTAYDAEGLIQPSSRQVEGRRVFALIGPEGNPVAYLDIPPGLDARPLMTKRVGIRGDVHYDNSLNARLIAVHDLEPLD